MTKTATVIRFEHSGPNGLAEWDQMDYASLVSGTPVQRGHLYHEIPAQGFMVGVWDCTAFTEQMVPYPVDEYMLFLEGDLTMVMPDGTEVQINTGDAFIIPKGLTCQWKQTGFVHKVFMILDGPVPAADNPSLHRVTVPDLSAPVRPTDLRVTRTDFMNAAGTMRVDIEYFGAVSQPGTRIDAHLLISVLSGQLMINDGERDQVFETGDTAYVHQGGTVGWATSQDTRVIVARYAAP